MSISIKNVSLFILSIIVFIASWYYFSFIFATIALVGTIIILTFAHKRKRPSTYNKHTKKRSGEVYDENQNEKRGSKNKKYKKKKDPNKNK